jgi:hypothetical protein
MLYTSTSAELSDRLWFTVVCRPFLGALIGAAVYLLTKAGVLVLTSPKPAAVSGTPGTPATATFTEINGEFFAGVAFLAGFSQRAARGMFDALAGRMGAREQGSRRTRRRTGGSDGA